jgi:hypothetical protein
MDMSKDKTTLHLNESNFDLAISAQYYNADKNPDVVAHMDHYVDISFEVLKNGFDPETGMTTP